METCERIEVYIRIEKGVTKCICHADRKMCKRECERDFVTRDKFDGWEKLLRRDKYGK